MAEKTETEEYRLKAKAYSVVVRGNKKLFTKGELVPLTATQYQAFKDQFEPKDAAENALKAQKEADAKAKAEKADSEDAKDARKKELEDRNKAEVDAKAKAEVDAKNNEPPISNPEPGKQVGGPN